MYWGTPLFSYHLYSYHQLFITILVNYFKLQLPYYNKHGLVISAKRKCILHYISRGFLLDIIGSFPVNSLLANLVLHDPSPNFVFLCQTLCKFAHLYLILGFFQYEADQPSVNAAYLTVSYYFLDLFDFCIR